VVAQSLKKKAAGGAPCKEAHRPGPDAALG